ncbi:cell envelope biogenesis protein TolA [Mesorhizobium sp. AD1-1]|uniref:cell envelope biogenesis protein TolA n=1 Tax=Mesorhizobium sp. AD1-1 TaxID=2876621 RepID=UPI001CCD5E19|nr:cell envelope biogenesis protein TolA [Mesorhizobium sp. AD1-1]MBZ9719174.1 cell envelope biogenesis protein TolA [Mesorhizobium sp. AD1-1]
MGKKLKVYQTSIGFFDLAVAAPSMKAAAEAWGSDPDIFKRGFAKQTEDPKVMEAAKAMPGVVLRRPVGSRDKFTEKPALPRVPEADQRTQKDTAQREHFGKKADTKSAEKAKLKASAALEKEKKREALARAKAEVERAREIRQRELAIAKANTVFERARRRHDHAMNTIRQRREELDEEEADEDEKWRREQQAHNASLNEAKA